MYLVVSPEDIAYTTFGFLARGKLDHAVQENGSPEETLAHLLAFLSRKGVDPENLSGIVVVTGPGSPTALRAGTAVVNTLAFVLGIPLFPLENPQKRPLEELLEGTGLSFGVDSVVPSYGRAPNITTPSVS